MCAAAACGKKGPPLAPLVPIPAAVETIETLRMGSDVYVTVTLPAANVDQHVPADLDRVEVYAYTGRSAPSRPRWAELGTLVATVPVAEPPQPEEGDSKAKSGAANGAEKPVDSKKKSSNLPAQGAVVTVHDLLTAEELVQGRELQPAARAAAAASRGTASTGGKPEAAADKQAAGSEDPARREPEAPLKRFYTAIPFNTKGRNGPPGAVAELPLVPMPDAPPALRAQYSDRGIVLEWEPSGGLIGFLLERALPEEITPFEVGEPAGGQTTTEAVGPLAYLVYREALPDPSTPPAAAAARSWEEEPPRPVTPTPVAALEFSDTMEYERRRCYTVRAVRGAGPAARIGSSSPAACITPVDVFPPQAPRSLAAVASAGRISLIWEPNVDPDVAGYIVLRGEAPGDRLQPLTTAPVGEAAYRDETVAAGVRYVYAVVAVDNRLPVGNMSAESNRVEETAR